MKIVSVEDQYNKFSSLKKEDVVHLMDWISKQPHLPSITGLFNFLRFNILTKKHY